MPIPETKPCREGLERTYNELLPAINQAGAALPPHPLERNMHLDPDFEFLTYGDRAAKGRQLKSKLRKHDLVVFYSGLGAAIHELWCTRSSEF
jgi:hypothetical protein